MYSLFSKKYEYVLREERQEFLVNLKNAWEKSSLYVEKYIDKDFIGNVTDESFTIKAVPSPGRRGIFNPIIYGSFIENNDTKKLFVTMKFAPFDYVSLLIALCFFFELIIYLRSSENDLNYFIYLIPLFIFIAISVFGFLVANINFREAKERLESILNKNM